MVDTLKAHLRKARLARWAKATAEEKREFASKGGRAYWKKFTKKQRSAEMKKRAKVRAKKRTAKRGK